MLNRPLQTVIQLLQSVMCECNVKVRESVIGCLHDQANIDKRRANIELAQAGLLEPRPLAQT